jgi:hypothetical protein
MSATRNAADATTALGQCLKDVSELQLLVSALTRRGLLPAGTGLTRMFSVASVTKGDQRIEGMVAVQPVQNVGYNIVTLTATLGDRFVWMGDEERILRELTAHLGGARVFKRTCSHATSTVTLHIRH